MKKKMYGDEVQPSISSYEHADPEPPPSPGTGQDTMNQNDTPGQLRSAQAYPVRAAIHQNICLSEWTINSSNVHYSECMQYAFKQNEHYSYATFRTDIVFIKERLGDTS